MLRSFFCILDYHKHNEFHYQHRQTKNNISHMYPAIIVLLHEFRHVQTFWNFKIKQAVAVALIFIFSAAFDECGWRI